MLAAQNDAANPLDSASRSALSTTPLLATCAIAGDSQRFPIPKWAPRQGRNRAYTVWISAVRQLFAAYGLTLDQLSEDAPSLPSSTLARRSTSATGTEDEAAAMTAKRMQWQAVNTAIYWHVRPSLIIAGPWHDKDLKALDSMFREGVVHLI